MREIPTTDGVTVFRIDVPKAREKQVVDCLRSQLPGIQALRKAIQ